MRKYFGLLKYLRIQKRKSESEGDQQLDKICKHCRFSKEIL